MNAILPRRLALVFALSFLPICAFATSVPINLTATPSGSSVTLTWTDNSTDETGFTLMWDTTSNFTNPSYIWTGGANTTSYVDAGRDPGTTYFYKIKAEGATDAQDSAFSAAVGATLAPVNLHAIAVTSGRVDLSWTGNPSNASISGYTVARNTSPSFSGANYQYVSGGGNVELSQTALAGGVTYYFAVKAEGAGSTNAYDSPWTAFVSAATPPSPAPISSHYYGINAWMPYQIGPHVFYGSLGSQWTNVQNSGAKIMRYGGKGLDQYADSAWADSTTSTLAQYLALVDNMQSRGIEPVLAVPVLNGTPAKAADVVRYVNVTNGRGVKYWIVGNEPDKYPYTPSQMAQTIISFSAAMKAVDPTIQIIGPELASYNQTTVDTLTDPTNRTCTCDITGADPATGRWYIDYFSFHWYNGFGGTQTRNDVVAALASTGFDGKMSALEARLADANSAHGRSGASALRIAITEANVNYQNNKFDGVLEAGAKSFVGGQWWAEFMGSAMLHHVDFITFWSTIEGSVTEGNELGFIGADGTTKRPSYYHFQMLAQNFRGSAVTTSDNQPLVKTFAAKDTGQIAVLLMNQEEMTDMTYTVRLNLDAPSPANTLTVNVDAGVPMQTTGVIRSQGTILLVFDASGVLRKKIDYHLAGQADGNMPPAVTTYP